MKYCIGCEQVKELIEFKKSYRKCKVCLRIKRKEYEDSRKDFKREKDKEYALKNKAKISQYGKEHYLRNKEKKAQQARNNYLKNKEKYTETVNKYRNENIEYLNLKAREWRQSDEGKSLVRAKQAKRRGSILNRTPAWLNKEQIKEIKAIYREARRLEKQDGIKRHVDHIVPLQGKEVSGLHVPWNLQILTAHENMSKSNRLISKGESNG